MLSTVINVIDILLTIGMIFMIVWQVYAAMKIEAKANPHLIDAQITHQFFYIYAQGGRRGFVRSFRHVYSAGLYLIGIAAMLGMFMIGFRGVVCVILFQSVFPVLLSCFIQQPYWWTDYDRDLFERL